jgi:hypothetical protein
VSWETHRSQLTEESDPMVSRVACARRVADGPRTRSWKSIAREPLPGSQVRCGDSREESGGIQDDHREARRHRRVRPGEGARKQQVGEATGSQALKLRRCHPTN